MTISLENRVLSPAYIKLPKGKLKHSVPGSHGGIISWTKINHHGVDLIQEVINANPDYRFPIHFSEIECYTVNGDTLNGYVKCMIHSKTSNGVAFHPPMELYFYEEK